MKRGKLIILEAGDGSGKETQSKRLYQWLIQNQYKAKRVEFPNYKSDSSALVRMYLDGKFGSNPGDVNPYIASTFYAVDRYASYKTEWEDFYLNGGIVLADRYTTSNMVHQASKIKSIPERESYLDWLWDLEFNTFQLPVPDCVLFLDVPTKFTKKNIQQRISKADDQYVKDIHESDERFLEESYKNSLWVAEKYKWNRINCMSGDCLKSIDDIHQEIIKVVKSIID